MKSSRRKPFSHAQKKEQLKKKRAQKRAGRDGSAAEPVPNDKPEQPAGGKHGKGQGKKDANAERRGNKPIREIYGLKTVFAREPDEAVAERKKKAHDAVKMWTDRREWEREELQPLHILGMPVRPRWTADMRKEELERREEEAFEDWMRSVYERAEELRGDGELNFFEHNLEVWRQLWRAFEMGDCLLICVDVRWPSFNFPVALFEYARHCGKPVVVTLTKTDLVQAEVAREWERYFAETYEGLTVALSHAFPEVEAGEKSGRVTKKTSQQPKALKSAPVVKEAILDACRRALDWPGPTEDKPFFTVSAVGAPNAGKSAVINLLVEAHKVAVSATPGKTKHFQTHFVSAECRLLDSPGLMFPSVAPSCRFMQVIVGNYPVSQVREPFSAVAFLAKRIDLPRLYGLSFPYGEDANADSSDDDRRVAADDDDDAVVGGRAHDWSAYEICEALAIKRGFSVKGGGGYDVYRSGKLILAEALRGILKSLYWKPPVV